MLSHALRVFFILLEVVVLFNLLIVVHELGHFLAARWRGLYIEKFGIWFGKPLWKKTIKGVQYSLGSIPFGGFVALPQLAPMDVIEGKADVDRAQLPKISALDKIIVAVAGPLFSLLLALFFACVVWAVGHPVSESDLTTVIGYVEPDSPAAKADLRAGDKILEVDGRRVSRFFGMNDSVVWAVVRSEGPVIPFKVEREGKTPERRRRAADRGNERLEAEKHAAGHDFACGDAIDWRSGEGFTGGQRRTKAGRYHYGNERDPHFQRRRPGRPDRETSD